MKLTKCLIWTLCIGLFISVAVAGSTKTSTTYKDGKKITTKVKTANDGKKTTIITTKDKEGNVSKTTTVTDKDGNIISTDDPKARAKAEAAAKQRKEQKQALQKAPKRNAKDPIQMALFQTVVSADLRKMTEKNGGVFPFLRKEFENDPVIKIMKQKTVDRYTKSYDFKTGQPTGLSSFNRGSNYLPADIYVKSYAQVKEQYGISKTTKKAASAPYLMYRAVISSEFSDKTWEVKESGHLLANQKVTAKFANKIRAVILGEAGGTIPKEAKKFRRGTSGMTQSEGNAAEALRNLFKKKK